MAFPRTFLRHTMLWSLPAGEIATVTVAWARATTFLELDEEDVDTLAAKGVVLWAALDQNYANEVVYDGSRVTLVGLDNKTVQVAERIIQPVAGTGAENTLPHEVSVVGSLKTTVYGRSGRGRMYLPPPNVGNVSDTGRLPAAAAELFSNALATYLGSDTTTGLFSVVASFTTGALNRVTSVGVGDVFDSQRRRRDNLVEIYDTSPVV